MKKEEFLCNDVIQHQIISIKGLRSIKIIHERITFKFTGVDRYWDFDTTTEAEKMFQKIKDSLPNIINVDTKIEL